MANGILIAAMDFSAAPEEEFHDWYDLEHIPERLRVPGFLNADRWIGTENPKISVATYDLDNVGVLHTPPYLAVGGENGSPWTKRTAEVPQGHLALRRRATVSRRSNGATPGRSPHADRDECSARARA